MSRTDSVGTGILDSHQQREPLSVSTVNGERIIGLNDVGIATNYL